VLIVEDNVIDGWDYAGMQNTDIGLVPLMNRPVCPVTVGTQPKMRTGQQYRPIGQCFSGPSRVLGQTCQKRLYTTPYVSRAVLLTYTDT